MRYGILLFFALLGCSTQPEIPAPFAREVVATVAAGDFAHFEALSVRATDLLPGDSSSLPGAGLRGKLAPMDDGRIRQLYDRVVRSGRIQPGDDARLEPVVVATEPDRWTMELFDESGRGIGIQMSIRKWNEGYRLLRIYPVEPGRARADVVAAAG